MHQQNLGSKSAKIRATQAETGELSISIKKRK
jgi:hypothetical protein